MDDDIKWHLINQKKAETFIRASFRFFREHGIEPILIKGWAAARNYPPNVPRLYGDTDIAVSAADYEKARTLVEGRNPEVRSVDLHRELRHLDTVKWDQLFSRSEIIDVDGEGFRVLAAEDHLRVLCAHWLTNGGEHRERLFDIFYAVQNRPVSFDWSKCLDVVSPSRRSWIVASVGLAHKYLGLNLTGVPFADEAANLPRWLTDCVERAWSDVSRLRGIDESITDPRQFLRQVGKRIPPNPIQATVFCDGMFDDRSRIGYQIRDTFGRMIPSVKRLSYALVDQFRWLMKRK